MWSINLLCVFQYILISAICNVWIMVSISSKWTHVKMLIVQETWKSSLNHSSIIVKYWVACVLVYCNKYKMQYVNNGFNILKISDSILIIEKVWKESLIHSNIMWGLNCCICFNKLC
jgi:hypothetical protein